MHIERAEVVDGDAELPGTLFLTVDSRYEGFVVGHHEVMPSGMEAMAIKESLGEIGYDPSRISRTVEVSDQLFSVIAQHIVDEPGSLPYANESHPLFGTYQDVADAIREFGHLEGQVFATD